MPVMVEKDAEKNVVEYFQKERKELPEELKSEIDKYPEIAIWMLIETTGRQVYEMGQHLEKLEEMDKEVPTDLINQMEHCESIQSYAASKVTEFGVQFENRIMSVQGNYWIWYGWWKDYMDGLSEEEFKAIDTAIKTGEDVSKYRPEKSWVGIIH